MTLLAIIAASFLSAGNTSYQLARNAVELAERDALGEAAVNRAVLGLLEARPDRRWRTDGIAQNIDFAGTRARISIQDELGRIDINHADGTLLVSLFPSVGLDEHAAGSMVDKVLDWRDSSPLKRLNGAKAKDYRLAGYDYRPRSGPFQSLDELKLIIGMTPELFRRVEPAITVYSGHPFIDSNIAPREALLALPNMDTGKVASIIAARDQQAARAAASAMLIGRAFSIRAEIERSSHVIAQEAVIRLTGAPTQPYLLLNWKRIGALGPPSS
jgi:general secretion pathway protein K